MSTYTVMKSETYTTCADTGSKNLYRWVCEPCNIYLSAQTDVCPQPDTQMTCSQCKQNGIVKTWRIHCDDCHHDKGKVSTPVSLVEALADPAVIEVMLAVIGPTFATLLQVDPRVIRPPNGASESGMAEQAVLLPE